MHVHQNGSYNDQETMFLEGWVIGNVDENFAMIFDKVFENLQMSKQLLCFEVLEYLHKMETLKMTFFSWSEFSYWTKVKAKYVF